jgi:hypothetical protein
MAPGGVADEHAAGGAEGDGEAGGDGENVPLQKHLPAAFAG